MFEFRPVRVGTGFDEEGLLVFAGERLIAVLVRLSHEDEIAPGHWFLEIGFGLLNGVRHPTFADLDAAQDWIARRLGSDGGKVARTIG